MAPRRRKGRKGARQRAPQNGSDAMASHESNAPHSARPSTDGTMSSITASDGPATAMTSLMGTEEDVDDTPAVLEDADDEDVETVSIYPASQFPPSRTGGGHFVSGDSRTIASDMGSSTRSLWTREIDYREIHGRRYCRHYFMPNDELEQLRLTLQHQVLLHVLDNELTLAPIQYPTHVLDVGTGTGEWAIRFAELYSHCEVVGTDISPIQETQSVPINVFFEVEDAEDWDRPPDHYDLIHFRLLQGAFRNWSFIYGSVYYSLKPGGWIEVQDFDISEDGLSKFLTHFQPDSPIHDLFRDVGIAAELAGRKRGIQHLEPHKFIDAGFVDVRSTEYTIPITAAEQYMGKIWLIACLDALEAICLRLLTEYMDWDPEVCKLACERAAGELAHLARDPATAKTLLIKLRIIVARKPLDAPPSAVPWPPGSPYSEKERDEQTPPCEPEPNGAHSSCNGSNGFHDHESGGSNSHAH